MASEERARSSEGSELSQKRLQFRKARLSAQQESKSVDTIAFKAAKFTESDVKTPQLSPMKVVPQKQVLLSYSRPSNTTITIQEEYIKVQEA